MVPLSIVIDCMLVTCDYVTALDPDDRLLATELRKRGLSVVAAVWSDPEVDWSAVKVCVLRSTWDYHSRFEEFSAWIDRVSRVTAVWNPPELVRWSADKGYLRKLENAGVRIVPTVWAMRGEDFDLYRCCKINRFRDVVIKPAKGAATHDVLLVHGDNESLRRGQTHLHRLVQDHDALVQPYLHSVTSYGERALIFIASRYSHTIVKKPFDKLLEVRASTKPVEAAPDEIELATTALSTLPIRPMYARVDLLRDFKGEACVSEVELIEPGLYFGAFPTAITTLADALERQLDTATSR